MRPVQPASYYFKSLHLEEREYDLEEVEEEHTSATEAWATVATDGLSRGRVPESQRLLKALGVIESEDVREAVDALSEWDEASFVDWYVTFMFAEDEGEDHSDYEDETELKTSDEGAKGGGSWAGVKWNVNPSKEVVEGETWKCEKCFVVNEWEVVRCKACSAQGTHPPALEAAKAPKLPCVSRATRAGAQHRVPTMSATAQRGRAG